MSQTPVFIVQGEGANLRVVCADLAEALEQADALSWQYQRRDRAAARRSARDGPAAAG